MSDPAPHPSQSNVASTRQNVDERQMISVVVPVKDEVENLELLYKRLSRAAQSWGCDYEVVAVDDGSEDGSQDILKEIHQNDPRWKILEFSRNFGHQSAVSAGIHYACGDAVVVIDADLQDPPEIIEQLIARWRAGCEAVHAVRTNRKENILKRAAYRAFYLAYSRLTSFEVPLDSGDFCLMDRKIVDVMRALPERTRFVRGLRAWTGFRQTTVKYERQERHAGETKYTLHKLMELATDGILSFSSKPLKLAGWFGAGACAVSAVTVVLLVIWWLVKTPILGFRPSDALGWTSLFSLVLALAGVQMLLIGLIGASRGPCSCAGARSGRASTRSPPSSTCSRSASSGRSIISPAATSRRFYSARG